MTTIFDGMAVVLNDVFGADVVWSDMDGRVKTIRAVLRETPIEVAGSDGGAVLIEEPTLRVPATIAGALQRGDVVRGADGRGWRIESAIPGGSPASDAFRLFTLERVA